MELHFRIDTEGAPVPLRPVWRARRQTSEGWAEFTLEVDFERGRCRLNSFTLDFRIVGTNLMRNTEEPQDEGEPRPAFLRVAHGHWMVLEVLVPGERKASFLLGIHGAQGQAMITSVPGDDPAVLVDLLQHLFGPALQRVLLPSPASGGAAESPDPEIELLDIPDLELPPAREPGYSASRPPAAPCSDRLPDLDREFDIIL